MKAQIQSFASSRGTRFFLVFLVSVTLPLLLIAPHSASQSPQEIKASEEKIRSDMVRISRELGVTCNACHVSENFKDDKMVNFKLAKEHMKITQLLIDGGFDGKGGRPLATCYMCHRGVLKPDYKEKKSPTMSYEF